MNKINYNDAKTTFFSDEEIFSFPPRVSQEIQCITIDSIIKTKENCELIKLITLTRGMAGTHNQANVEKFIMTPILQLARMVHLLPASENEYFSYPGGLFSYSLEIALKSIQYAERRILTRVTPEIRKANEVLWAHAAFLNGLFSEAITIISQICIYDNFGVEWNPKAECLWEWLHRNNLKSYHVHWRERPDRIGAYTLADHIINDEQMEILKKGEISISETLIGALHNQAKFHNPLAKINGQIIVSIKSREMERNEKSLAGRHLEYWITFAMQDLLCRKRWVVNEENGTIWHGQDGVFLVWPLAANNILSKMKELECPISYDTQGNLAKLMWDAGIIEINGDMKKYLFNISVPVAEGEEKKFFQAVKLTRDASILIGEYKPLPISLVIEAQGV